MNKQMSSYHNFIVNVLKNQVSQNTVHEALDNIIVFDEDNNLSSGKIKELLETMGLTETDDNGKVKGKSITKLRSDLTSVVETDNDGNVTANGSGFVNNMENSITLIQTTLDTIQTSMNDLTTRIGTLESTTSPVITLVGDSSITIDQGSVYEDAGATATNYVNNDITSNIIVGGLDTLNTSVVGVYPLTYDVSDAAGNAATQVTRTISVIASNTYININTNGFVSIVDGDYYLTENPTNSTNFTENPLDTSLVWSRNDGVDGKIRVDSITGFWEVVVNGTPYIWTSNTEAHQNEGFYIYGQWRARTKAYSDGYISEADWSFNMIIGDNIGTLIQPDTTVPVITLLGDASVTINQGSVYEDAGATAIDNADGDLTSTIVVGGLDTLDTNVVGDHTITYNVTDSSGNAATPVTRTISVIASTASSTYININTNGFVSIVDGDYYLTENPNNSSNFTQNPLDTALVWSRNDGVDGKIKYQDGFWVVSINNKNYIWTGNLEHQQTDENFYIYGQWRARQDAYLDGYISEADWSYHMVVGDNIGTLIQ